MAFTLFISLPFISTSPNWFFISPIPGIIPRILSIEPIFWICSIWSKKSSKSNSCFLSLAPSAFAFSMSIVSWAFSIKLKTSPIPKILEAILSGWKGSKSSNFSPIPMNFIGFCVTALIESAAPPLVSPSSLVSTTPSIPKALSKLSATLTASWPVIESTTKSISCGLTSDLIDFNSSINSSSIWSLPAVSIITKSLLFFIAWLSPAFAILTGFSLSPMLNTSMPKLEPTTSNCFIAAGL